ncbi:MAG: hypothetical protein NT169_21905 [Chloroflexi bacterium]|nr:hypothetical protein [Chloroflexota bacterium]
MTDPVGPQIIVEAGKALPIRAKAPGANEYNWVLQGDRGPSVPNTKGDALLYTAPEQGDAMEILTVTAQNIQGLSPPTSLVIFIRAKVSVRLDALAMPYTWSFTETSGPLISIEASPDECHTGVDCLKFTYLSGGMWGGTRWSPMCIMAGLPVRQIGLRSDVCPINVLDAADLGKVNRLTFWARGTLGNEIVEFKIGDPGMLPTPGRSLGNVTLTATWKRYEIPLENVDLTKANLLFAWMATDFYNPKGAVFYLDDILLEGIGRIH